MNKRISLFLSVLMIASAGAGVVEAQVLPTKSATLGSVTDIDPSLLDLGTDSPIARQTTTCGDCNGIISFRFNNVRPNATNNGFEAEVQIRAEQPPGEGTFSASNPGNILNSINITFAYDTLVMGQNAYPPNARVNTGNSLCVADSTEGGAGSTANVNTFLEPNSADGVPAFGIPEIPIVIDNSHNNSAGGFVLANPWATSQGAGGPNSARTARSIPSDDWGLLMTLRCRATSGQEDNAAKIAFQAVDFNSNDQLVDPNVGLRYAARVSANNSLWHFPMDGEPAIIDAEVGNGIADGEFYVDLTFSEGVYGATGVSRGAVAASALNIFRVDRAEFTNAAPTVSTAGTAFSPTRVTRPGGAALVGGDRVIRAHFASSNHPNVLHTASTAMTLIAIRPAGTEAIYDANDNQIHGGSDDWYMQVLHDRHAPYISAAEVGPASTYIDLTFSEGVKFARTASPVPTPADFKLTRYIGGGPSSATVTINSVTVEEGVVSSAIKVRLNIDSTGFTSDDRMDIRIAEQVKEPTFPSLASVFTADPNSVKYDSSFPRTAAPAQIGSLQLMGKDRYSIRYTQSYITSDGSTLITDILSGNGATHSNSPLIVDEGDPAGTPTGSNPRGIVIEIRRTESDPDTITLRIARTDGDTDDGVSFRVQGEASDVVPSGSAISVRFASNEMTKRVAIRVVGDDGPTGDREYTLTLETVNSVTQEINPSRRSVSLVIREDDDQTPPVVSDRGSLEIVEFGATEVTLGWQEGTDENMLRYTLVVTEIGGRGASTTFERTPGTSQARVTRRFTRTDVVLIPGRTYSFALSVQDVFDNPTVPIAYTSEPEVTMLPVTGLTDGDGDGIPDELESAVADDISGYCGAGGEMGDADGDGISNDIEVRFGLECRMGEPGSAIAQAGEISLTVEDLAGGAIMPTADSAVLIPGTGEMTGINSEAVTCPGCSAIRTYQVVDSGRSPLGGALGSFSTRVMWVGMDGDVPIAVLGRKIYVAPPVGFDVGVVSLSSGETSDNLLISVAVSSGSGDFSVGDLVVSGSTLTSGLERTGSNEQLSNQIRVTGISAGSLVTMTSAGGSMFSSNDNSLPQGDLSDRLNRNNLFSIGNAEVEVVARPRATTPTAVVSTMFRQAFDELFDDDGEYSGLETTSDDISVPGSTTARSGIYISVGRGIALPSDSTPLSTEVTTAAGVDINTEVGVFDYAIDLSEPGDIATALLRLSTAVQIPSDVYKFDALTESWGPFIATIEGDTRYDRVYSAPTSDGQCPELSGSRQPDPTPDLDPDMDPGVGGVHGYAWNLAVLTGNNVRVGDECLLVQIQDGSSNDADDAVEGTVFDPVGLVMASDGGGGGGGGGAMSPIWLILLALAMMLPYGLRRRQSSPFISDL